MGKVLYKDIDELPDLTQEPIHQLDLETKQVKTYKSIDELPDLKKKVGLGSIDYEASSLEAGNKLAQEANNLAVKLGEGKDPITLSLQADELANKKANIGFGMGVKEVPDENSVRESEAISTTLKDEGYDSKGLAAMFKDLPKDVLEKRKTYYNELLNTNPTFLERSVAHDKWRTPVFSTIDKLQKEAIERGELGAADFIGQEKDFLKNLPNEQRSHLDNRTKVKTGIELVRKYSDTPDKSQKDFATEVSIMYGTNLIGNPKSFDNHELKVKYGLTPNQITAYEFIEDTQPEQAQQYKGLFIDPSKVPTDFETQLGREDRLLKLEQIGIGLKNNAILEKRDNVNQQINKLGGIEYATPELLAEKEKNDADILQLENDKEAIKSGTKYSRLQANDAELFAKEILGKEKGFGEWAIGELGKATSNTVTGVVDFIATPFRSDESNYLRQFELIGQGKLDEEIQGLPQGEQMIKSFTPIIHKELATKIDVIKNNNSLSDKEKNKQVVQLLKDNPTEWEREGIEGGETNVNLKSMLYGTTQLAANLAPFVAISAATGGGGGASALRKFTTEFAAAAATSFNDVYTQAISEGDANPYAKALRVTAINSAAMAGAGSASEIRAMLSKSPSPVIKQLVEKLTDKEIQAVLRTEPKALTSLRKAYNITENVAKKSAQHFGGAAKMVGFTTAGQVVNEAIDGEIKPIEETAKHAAIELLKFGVFGTLTSAFTANKSNPTELNKSVLYDAAKSSESYLKVLEEKLADKTISVEEANQVKTNIEAAKKVLETVPMVDAKGNELTDASKRELLFLKLQEKDIDAVLKSDIPEALADKLGKRIEGIHEKMDKVYKGTYLFEVAQPKKEKPTPNVGGEDGLTEGANKILGLHDNGVSFDLFDNNKLREIAKENGIDLPEGAKNADIIEALKNKRNEATAKGLENLSEKDFDKLTPSQKVVLYKEHGITKEDGSPITEKDIENSPLQYSYDFMAYSDSGKWNSANSELESAVQGNRKQYSLYKLMNGEFDTFKEFVDFINSKNYGDKIEYTDRMKRADDMSPEERKAAVDSYNKSVEDKVGDKSQKEKDILDEHGLKDETEYSPHELVEKFPLKGVQKVIWDIISPIVKKLGIKVKFSSSRITEGFDGSSNPMNGEVLLRPSTLKNGRLGEVLVHEVVHSLTTKIISRVNSGVETGLTSKQVAAVKGLGKLYKSIEADNNLQNKYPVKDIFEFIAHLTNDTFVKELQSKDRNFIQKVVDFISDILGLSDANELAKKYLKDIIHDGTFLEKEGITVVSSDYAANVKGAEGLTPKQRLLEAIKNNSKTTAEKYHDLKSKGKENDFTKAVEQSLKETPTPKGNTSNVVEGSVGVGGEKTYADFISNGRLNEISDKFKSKTFDELKTLLADQKDKFDRKVKMGQKDQQLRQVVWDLQELVSAHEKANGHNSNLSQKDTKFATENTPKDDGFDYVRNKFSQEGVGGKRLSDKESNILNKEVDKLIDRAEKENGVKRNELKQATWKTNDGYTVTDFFENGRGGTRIITPKGEEINLFDNKYKGESGRDISYFSKAHEPFKATEQSLKETTKAETPTTTKESNVVEGSVGVGGDVETKQQIENFGVNKEDVEPVHSVISQVFNGLKNAGLTAAKTVGDWVGIGKGTEKPYSLKIDGKDVKVKPTSPEVVNGFYSPLEKVITDSKFDKLPAKQWAEKYANSEEAKWTGLKDWLAQQRGSVSKADIQQYLKDNRIQVVEVVKGEVSNFTKDDISDVKINQHGAGNWVVKTKEDGTVEFPLDKADDKAEAIEYALEQLNYDNKSKRESKPKFQQYQTEGEKSNYKEVLVTMPDKKQSTYNQWFNKWDGLLKELYEKYNVSRVNPAKDLNEKMSPVDKQRFDILKSQEPSKEKTDFRSSHFDEPNILVHLRMNTRVDVEGKKVLFLEEVQSDWGQKGKKEGFDSEKNDYKEIADRFAKGLGFTQGSEADVKLALKRIKQKSNIWEREYAAFKEAGFSDAEINKMAADYTDGQTPSAPFVTDTNAWTKLGLKVALKEAVKQGAEKIAWTTGEQQNDRYDLSKQVDRIDVEKVEGQDNLFFVDITMPNGEVNYLEVENGKVRNDKSTYQGQRLEDLIGKDMAEKILTGESQTIKGEGLKVGGKGMKGFYGSPTEKSLGIVGNVAKSLFKQEPKTVTIKGGKGSIDATSVDAIWVEDNGKVLPENKREDYKFNDNEFVFTIDNNVAYRLYDKNDIRDAKNREVYTIPRGEIFIQHSIDITPELKASVEGGQPLFKDAEAQYRIENGKNIVEAIKDFDGSPRATVALTHEVMHPTVVAIIDGAKEGNEVGKKHTKTIVDEFNKANPNNKVTAEDLIKGNDAFKEGTTTKQYRQVQEFIAKSWEKYHREGGKGFSEQFQKVLDQITKAFKAVYKSLKGEQLTPELRKMFDEILGKEAAEQSLKETTKAETPTQEVKTVEKKNTGTEIEPELSGGRKQVTLSGSTEVERQRDIEQRKKETKTTPMTEDRDAILEKVAKFNSLDKVGKRRNIEEVNKLKIAIDNFNKKHNQQHTITRRSNGDLEVKNNPSEKRPSGRAIKYSLKKQENNIVENGKTLTEREEQTQKVFQDLLDNDALPPARDLNGNLFSADAHEATIQDIMDGIPSQRAENYLNRLGEMASKDRFDFGDPNPKAELPTLKDVLGIEVEKGEEMTPEAVEKWLSEEGELTPEQQETFDNIDNLITHYEQEYTNPESGVTPKVQESNAKPTEGSGIKANENEQPKNKVGENKAEIKTNGNEEAKKEKPTTEGLTEITGGNEPKPEQKGSNPKEDVGENIQPQQKDLGIKAREEAAKFRSGEKNILPEWLRAKLPEGTKKSGVDINEVYAKALETFADIHDATKDFAKAIDEAVKHIKKYFDDNKIPYDEGELRTSFEGEVKGKETVRPLNDKALANNLINAKRTPKSAKEGIEKEGLEYEPQSQKEAQELANSIIDEIGIDAAVEKAQANKFGGDVNTLVQTEALNRLAELSEKETDKATQLEHDLKFAEISIALDKSLRKQGQGVSAVKHFYKKSPLGVQLVENASRKKDFDNWAKPKEKSWKEVFTEMMKEPEFEAAITEQVKEGMKQERAEARKNRIKKVDDFFDKAKDEFKGGAAYSMIIPPKVITTALEGMKQAYHAGENVVKLIEDAIDYISNELGGASWDKDKFRNEWNEKLKDPTSKKPLTDEQVKAKILDRFRNKLKGLTDKQKEDVVRKSFQKIVESGGLDYADFRKIIADVTGRGEMTDAEAIKLKELVKLTNSVEDAGKAAREERTPESLKRFRQAEIKAGEAARELNTMLYNRPNITKRLTSVMQLNTLGIAALVNNPIYNVWNQVTLRTPVGFVKTLLDKAIYKGAKMLGKEVLPETNILSRQVQKEFFKKLGFGTKESVSQLFTGLNRQDYIQKEIHGQSIRPTTAWMDLWAFHKGEKHLSKKQVVDKLIQGTVGVPAEVVARILNLGDKPQRFGAEGSQGSAFAKALGLKDMDYNLFIDFPREEAYRVYKERGLSDAEAGKKADYIKDTIIKEGQRSTFQQDNMLNDLLGKVFGGEQSGIGSLAKAVLISPYIKIPSNAYWSYYNLVNPEVAMLQSMIYGTKAAAKHYGLTKKFIGDKDNTTAAKDLNEAKYWFAHAAVGMATRAVVISLVSAGVFRSSNDEENTKKEREGEQNYEQQGTINVSKLMALMQGKNPNDVKNGLVVQNRWFGHWGTVGNTIARKNEDMTPEQKEAQDEFWNVALGGLELEALKDLNQGVFGNTSSFLSGLGEAVKTGEIGKGLESFGVNNINMALNVIHPAALSQVSKAQLPYYTKQKADTFLGEIKNVVLSRSSLIRNLSGQYPPSKIGIWGDKIEKKDNIAMRLFGISRSNDNNFAQPIYEDYKRTNDTRFFPSAVKPEIKSGGETVNLNTKESSELEELVGQQRKMLAAPYMNDMANFEGSSKNYSQLTDEEKLDKLKIIYDLGYENGKELFFQKHPKYKYEKSDEIKKEDKKESRENRQFKKSLLKK